jgi:hypothetical protein
MNATATLFFVPWVFSVCRFVVGDASSVEAPIDIPDYAEVIVDDISHMSNKCYKMSMNIRLFIQNMVIYVYYENMDGLMIWQSVEIPRGLNVREDFQLMCYSWYNREDDGFPQNLQILVFFDGGFLKLTFSSKSAHHKVESENFVQLVDIAFFPYASIPDACHGQQTMHQYAYDNYMLFVSASRCNGKFVLTFEQIFFDDRFEHVICKVVLPLSEDVVIEYLRDLLEAQTLFFDHNGNPTEPNMICYLEATISGESFLMKLILDPQYKQSFTDDGTEGLGVYSQRATNQDVRNFNCIKSSESELVGYLSFQDSELDPARLLEIFPVK